MPTALSTTQARGLAKKTLMRRLLRTVSCVGLMGGLTGCPPEQKFFASLTMLTSPSEQRVAQGATTLFTVSINRKSFTGPVTLSVAPGGLPKGIVSLEFDPATLPEGMTVSTARVTVDEKALVQYGAEPPLTEIPILATASDGLDAKSQVRLRIVASSLAGITLNAAPAELAIGFGDVGQSLLTIARQGNYAGAVTLSVVDVTGGINGEAGKALIPTVTPVAGVPDTWLLGVLADNSTPEKFQSLVALGALRQRGIFKIRATATGIAPVETSVGATVVLPFFEPAIADLPISIDAGKQKTVAMILGRAVRFTAPITMAVVSAPVGINASFDPNPALDDVTYLTLRVAANVTPGEYEVLVKGTPQIASGAVERELRVPVIVAAFEPPESYTLTVPNLTVAAGSAVTGTISVTRAGGFSDDVRVTLARAGNAALPPGMTLTPNPIPNALPTTTLTVGTTSATPAGVYSMIATGTTPLLENVVSTFTVTVTAPPQAPRPTTISVVKLVNGTPQLTTAETVAIGSTVSLIPVVLDQNQQPMLGAAVTWTSNSDRATVTNNGVVTGAAPGIATVTVRPVDNPNIQATVAITVPAPPPISNVARIELEPKNAEITSPATQQYRVTFYDAAGARMSVESGGVLQFSAVNVVVTNPPVATINASTGLAVGVTAGPTNITARYLRNGVFVTSDETPLTVYAANSAGHYGSATISTNGDTRTLRAGVPLLFQIIVRNTGGSPVTSGVTPAPTVASSSGSVAITTCTPSIVQCQGLPAGYFFIMTAAANATVGSTTRIRYDVTGAGGEITMTITP